MYFVNILFCVVYFSVGVLCVRVFIGGKETATKNDLCLFVLCKCVSFLLILKGNNLKCSIITQYQQWNASFLGHIRIGTGWNGKKCNNRFHSHAEQAYSYPLSRQRWRRKTCVRRYRLFNNIICTLIVVDAVCVCARPLHSCAVLCRHSLIHGRIHLHELIRTPTNWTFQYASFMLCMCVVMISKRTNHLI